MTPLENCSTYCWRQSSDLHATDLARRIDAVEVVEVGHGREEARRRAGPVADHEPPFPRSLDLKALDDLDDVSPRSRRNSAQPLSPKLRDSAKSKPPSSRTGPVRFMTSFMTSW